MIRQSGRYGADIGSLKISVPGGSSFFFGNDYGDGFFHFYIVDSTDDLPEGHRNVGCFQIEHTAYIMGADCDGYVADNGTLEPGAYIVEAYRGDVYLWKLSVDAEYWGGNID